MYRSVFDDPLLILSLAWFYLTSTCLVAWAASQRGRSGAGWPILSLVVNPMVCILALIAATKLEPRPPRELPKYDPEKAARVRAMEHRLGIPPHE